MKEELYKNIIERNHVESKKLFEKAVGSKLMERLATERVKVAKAWGKPKEE